jgi:hypothetical protein
MKGSLLQSLECTYIVREVEPGCGFFLSGSAVQRGAHLRPNDGAH